jgi:hypothetical protein
VLLVGEDQTPGSSFPQFLSFEVQRNSPNQIFTDSEKIQRTQNPEWTLLAIPDVPITPFSALHTA